MPVGHCVECFAGEPERRVVGAHGALAEFQVATLVVGEVGGVTGGGVRVRDGCERESAVGRAGVRGGAGTRGLAAETCEA